MFKKSKQKPMTESDYERIGRSLESVFESGYSNHRRVYWINLVRGIMFGFGAAIGGTILIALLAWILSLAGHIPFLGEISNNISNTIQSSEQLPK